MRSVGLPFLVAVAAACTPYAAPSATPNAPSQEKPSCGAPVDVDALLARHEKAFGSAKALVASLPVSARGEIALDAKRGPHVLVLGKDAHVEEAFVGGLSFASGHAAGADWIVGGPQGVRETLVGHEATDVAFDAFMWRRGYVAAMRERDVHAACLETPDAVRAEVAIPMPEVGSPILTFDLVTGALLAAVHAAPDGSTPRTTFDAWSEPDETGIRWPKQITTQTPGSTPAVVVEERVVRGTSCIRLGPSGAERKVEAAACFAEAAPHTNVTWPPEGVVRVPMRVVANELALDVRLGTRTVKALLDSGAGITVVDATMPAASAFVPTMELEGRGATQKLRLGIGELSGLELGGLRVDALPAASVPVPALASLGDARPEIVLGYTFFALGAVRIDYARHEIAIARRGADVVGPRARPVPFHVLGGKLVVEADVEGKPAAMILDTGNAGAVDLFARWATPARVPGTRRKGTLRALFGAGSEESEDVFFRLGHAAIGPLVVDDVLAQVSDQPGASAIAGLAGNTLFARCDAVVFDHARRTLWLEGRCDRPVPAARFGWRLVPNDADDAGPRWAIGALLSGAAADVAGLRAGDLLLEIDGRPVTRDLTRVWEAEDGPEGASVQVTVLRGSARLTRTVTLRAPFR